MLIISFQSSSADKTKNVSTIRQPIQNITSQPVIQVLFNQKPIDIPNLTIQHFITVKAPKLFSPKKLFYNISVLS